MNNPPMTGDGGPSQTPDASDTGASKVSDTGLGQTLDASDTGASHASDTGTGQAADGSDTGTSMPVDASACAASYETVVLADSPRAYYRMNEPSGTVMADSTANHLDGSYGAGVQLAQTGLVPSSSDTAPHFPGGLYAASNVALVPPGAGLQATNAFSVEMLFEEDAVNPGTVGDGYIDLVSYDWSLQITPTNHLEFYFDTAMPNNIVTAQLVPMAGYHVVATYDGAMASIYVDGELEASAPATGPVSYMNAGAGLTMGGFASYRAVLAGKVGEVALYSTALSPTRVMAHYQATGLGGPGSCPQ